MVYTTGDNNYGPTKWLVDPTAGHGTHTTLAGASASAVSGDTVYIRGGTYTENWTPTAGVAYVVFGANAFSSNTMIVGKMTITAAGSYSFSGISFKTNGDNILAITGSNAITVALAQCKIDAHDATAISVNNANATINAVECVTADASNNLLWNITSGALVLRACITNSLSTGVSTIAAGTMIIYNSDLSNPISASGSTSLTIVNSFLNCAQNVTPLAITGTVVATANNTSIAGGTAVGVSVGSGTTCVLTNCNVNSSNTNAISGSGTLQYANLTLQNSIVLQSTLTLVRLGIAQAGTFTPVVSGKTTAGTGTYTKQLGRYQVIGRLCFINIDVVWSAHTGTGVIEISGLPFTASTGNDYYPLKAYTTILVATATEIVPLVPSSTSVVDIYGMTASSGAQSNSSLAANTNVSCILEGFYEI